MDHTDQTNEFFDRYARALLARDAEQIADLYAVPALIVSPGQSIAVTDRSQTRDFFAAGMAGYDDVTDAAADVAVLAQTGHSVWADVTWRYDGDPRERYLYQLVAVDHGWQIAVLTPLEA
ncbi:nuclear transport factor 2 family protein [Ruania zhangjianzhongii]|uniref:nuclear transport factor 2 family protein n=1 Tax=Ruania zhangjianzhongii TaxID=2603206 RepID=UPI0011C9E717|nr:nuclear transport factor 2 family protein [Ruania zhangjianzhongii]